MRHERTGRVAARDARVPAGPRYQPGKADWFAAGLAREGTEARTPLVADIAQRDAPTCGVDERVGAVRDRVRERGWDVCVVADDGRVVLGLVHTAMLDVDVDTPVEQVMQSSPITFRPSPQIRAPHSILLMSPLVALFCGDACDRVELLWFAGHTRSRGSSLRCWSLPRAACPLPSPPMSRPTSAGLERVGGPPRSTARLRRSLFSTCPLSQSRSSTSPNQRPAGRPSKAPPRRPPASPSFNLALPALLRSPSLRPPKPQVRAVVGQSSLAAHRR